MYGATSYPYTYSSSSNRLSTVAGPVALSYQYDAAGNTSTDGSRSYSYDARGRLIQANWGSLQASYSVNALGQRVVKTPNSGAATVFLYDASGQLIAQPTTAGVITTEYFYLNGTPLALATAPSALYFIYPDHIDTPRVVSDASGNIVWRWDSADAFGSTAANSNPSGLGTFTFNLRFPGQYFDQETQTHYNYFRDYDPVLQRL